MAEKLLAVFEVQAKGARLYECSREACVVGMPVTFRRDPGNRYDPHCVEVFLCGRKLGHVAKTAARFVSRLLQGPFRVTGKVKHHNLGTSAVE